MHSVLVNHSSDMFWPLSSWPSKGAHKFCVGQELRRKRVRAIINVNIMQQVDIKYYICNTVACKMYNRVMFMR
jgi:TM2 domain-containing membrane protein YozV